MYLILSAPPYTPGSSLCQKREFNYRSHHPLSPHPSVLYPLDFFLPFFFIKPDFFFRYPAPFLQHSVSATSHSPEFYAVNYNNSSEQILHIHGIFYKITHRISRIKIRFDYYYGYLYQKCNWIFAFVLKIGIR